MLSLIIAFIAAVICVVVAMWTEKGVGSHHDLVDTLPRYSIVNLVIYNESSSYERLMRRELERLEYRGVKRLFVSLSPECTAVHERDGTLYVPGSESFIPGILHKTLEALSYCASSFRFEFVVRSNISTVIDFDRLMGIIPHRNRGVLYASTHIWGPGSPVGAFASGTNIVLNAAAASYVLSARGYLNMDAIDDVSIGELMRRVTKPLQLNQPMVWNDDSEASSIGVVFRNRSEDRMNDVARMARIVDRIKGSM
jgi:hypothetical protein